jgi:glycerol uptake facilitator-like aquaporin
MIAVKTSTLVLIRACAAEFFATFIFIFAVTCNFINLSRTGILLSSIILGGLVTAFTAIVVSAAFGAHFNPAVTFGAVLAGIIPWWVGLMYAFFQIVASVLACLCLMMIFNQGNSVVRLVVVQPGAGESLYKAFNAEVMYTFIFVLVIYMVAWSISDVYSYALLAEYPVSKEQAELDEKIEATPASQFSRLSTNTEFSQSSGNGLSPASRYSMNPSVHEDAMLIDNNEIYNADLAPLPEGVDLGEDATIVATVRPLHMKSAYVPVAIGVTLGFLSMISGTSSGGAFNPARAIGPCLISWTWYAQWVYWVGDLLGAGLAVGVGVLLFSGKVISPRRVNQPIAYNNSPPAYMQESPGTIAQSLMIAREGEYADDEVASSVV